ncbi:hypothetical protein [Kocuria rhizophila]|uniref:hypothetical protein n=1 Tax=Kocuria rhizophila TaxID=72000 RepID=UPI0021B2A9AF|nr:hypothetical protein [Kocuria rhizophila]
MPDEIAWLESIEIVDQEVPNTTPVEHVRDICTHAARPDHRDGSVLDDLGVPASTPTLGTKPFRDLEVRANELATLRGQPESDQSDGAQTGVPADKKHRLARAEYGCRSGSVFPEGCQQIRIADQWSRHFAQVNCHTVEEIARTMTLLCSGLRFDTDFWGKPAPPCEIHASVLTGGLHPEPMPCHGIPVVDDEQGILNALPAK